MILITGASGFLGKTIKNSFDPDMVISVGRNNADIMVNLANGIPTLPTCDIIIHAAGKAHKVPKNNAESQDFFDVNVKGTINLLKGLDQTAALPKSFIFISSVSVYGLTTGTLISENHPTNAKDAYGKSKIEAEKLVLAWCEKNKVICTILRLPLVIGTNAPGNLRSMISGIKKGYYFNIAGGKAKKSMVLADDVAKIIPAATTIGGIYHLTDGYNPSFSELSELVSLQLHKKKPSNIPIWIASVIAKFGDLMGKNAPINSDKLLKITCELTFDDSKAVKKLGWTPTPILKGFTI